MADDKQQHSDKNSTASTKDNQSGAVSGTKPHGDAPVTQHTEQHAAGHEQHSEHKPGQAASERRGTDGPTGGQHAGQPDKPTGDEHTGQPIYGQTEHPDVIRQQHDPAGRQQQQFASKEEQDAYEHATQFHSEQQQAALRNQAPSIPYNVTHRSPRADIVGDIDDPDAPISDEEREVLKKNMEREQKEKQERHDQEKQQRPLTFKPEHDEKK
jgi:hypothetical protein